LWSEFLYHKRGAGLRLWVMALLSKSPKNGAELMDEIERMTLGFWRPSPGSMYPLLEQLSEEGLVSKRQDGKYELTEKGKVEYGHLGWGPARAPATLPEMITEMSGYLSFMEEQGKASLAAYRDQLKRIADRLNRLLEGGDDHER